MPAARPTFVAALLVLAVGAAYVLSLVINRATNGTPGPGVILDEIVLVAVLVTIQAVVTLAVGWGPSWLHVLGALIAFIIVALCVVVLAAVIASMASVVAGGRPIGDFADLRAMLTVAPVVLAVGTLNGWAIWRTVRHSRTTPQV